MSCCGGKPCGPPNGAADTANSSNDQRIKDTVAQYYRDLRGTGDLKTSACTTCKAPPPEIRALLKQVPSEIVDR